MNNRYSIVYNQQLRNHSHHRRRRHNNNLQNFHLHHPICYFWDEMDKQFHMVYIILICNDNQQDHYRPH